jgi:hypothetical protein
MTDTYAKIILTVIAACLVAIVAKEASPMPIRTRLRWAALRHRPTFG